MKQQLLALCASLPLILSAQPYITNAGAPVAGQTWYSYGTEETTPIDLGTPGENQTWVFNGFSGPFEEDFITFADPSSLSDQFADLFPAADVVISYVDGNSEGHDYYEVTETGLYSIGYAWLQSGSELEVDEGEGLLIPFDITYEDVRNEQMLYDTDTVDLGIPTIIKSYDIMTFTGDAHGTVTTPAGTFSDVLRVHMVAAEVDSVFIDEDMDGTYTFAEADGPYVFDQLYFYLQDSSPAIVCVITTDEESGVPNYFTYFSDQPTSLEESAILPLEIYPNPSAGLVTMQVPEHIGKADLRVLDLNGRLIHSRSLQSISGQLALDLTQLSPGIYQLDLQSDGLAHRSKLVIE